MAPDDVLDLFALLDERGTVAWLLLRPDHPETEIVVDVSGLESIVSALVSRGFRADVSRLPDRVAAVHRRLGKLVIRPCRFDAAGNAYGHGDAGPLVLPAEAFDAVGVSLRTVRPTDGATE